MLNLEGTDEFVVELPRWPFKREVGGGEHDRIAHLVGRGWCLSGVGVFRHSFSGGHQGLFPSFECAGNLMGIGVGGRVHHFRSLGVLRLGVPSIVGVEGSHAGRRGYRVVVSMLGHRE